MLAVVILVPGTSFPGFKRNSLSRSLSRPDIAIELLRDRKIGC